MKQLTEVVLVVALVAVVAGCGSDAPPPDEGEGEGDGERISASDIFAGRFVEDETAYTGVFLVVDRDDAPVVGAQLRAGDLGARTDENGEAAIADVDPSDPLPIRVHAEGFVPRVVMPRLSGAISGATQVRMHRVSDPIEIDATARVALQRDGSQVQLQMLSLVSPMDGTRAERAIVALESLRGEEVDGRREVETAEGTQTIDAIMGAIFVEPRAEDGSELQLGDDAPAVIDIALSADGAQPGDVMSLASLDEQQGVFTLEGSCTVRASTADEEGPLACRGVVSHFSTWAALRLRAPAGGTPCVSFDVGYMGQDGLIDFKRLSCTDDRCEELSAFLPAVVLHGSQTGPSRSGWAARATHVGDDLNRLMLVRIFARTRNPFENRDGSTQVRRFLTDYAIIHVDRPGTLRGDPNTDLEACSLHIDLPAEWEDPDQDGDGFYPTWTLPPVYMDGELRHGGREDCDDLEGNVSPGARERPCNERDDDCNADTPDSGRYSDFFYAHWNSICSSECALPESDELPGNLYDENCDGRLADLDGDGADEATDCDDLNPDAHPDGSEQAGNHTDEDCDGQFLDFDGDGHLATRHAWLLPEGQLGDMPADDCNDARPDVHGGRDPADEAGQLATFFAPDDTRLASYCDYFGEDGAGNGLFRSMVQDLNCDGRFSDLDGDGFSAPADTALGAEAALDCDDVDPRVVPEGTADEPICEAPERLENLSECRGEPAGTGDRCPVLFGGTRHAVCLAALDADGSASDVSVCSFFGWQTSEPLVAEPGAAWGPCDGEGGLLPDCGDGLQCAGGGVHYSAALRQALLPFTSGSGLAFEGMCFPTCEPANR